MISFIKNNIAVLKYCKISFKRIILVYLLSFIIAILETTGIGMLLPIGEYLLYSESREKLETTSWKILYKVFEYLNLKANINYVILLAIIIIVTRQIFTYLKLILSVRIQQEIAKRLRESFFENLIETDLKYIKSFKSGANANLITTEIHNTAIAGVAPFNILTAVLLLLSYFIIMTVLSVKGTLLILIIGILLGSVVKFLNKKLHSLSKSIINFNNNFSQHFIERQRAIKLIKLNNLYLKEYLTNSNILKKQFDINVNLAKIQGVTATGLEPVVISILLPIVVIAVQFGIDLTVLGMYAIILARFIPTFKVIIAGVQSFIRFNASCEKILFCLDDVFKKKEIRKGTKPFPKNFKNIYFDKVYYKYLGSKNYIFKNFSATIKANKINAIIGQSGAGKTTLIDMLPLLIVPNKGAIRVDDTNINEIEIQKLRNSFAYVDQKPFFFRGTIMENLCYSQSKVNLKLCINAAKLAQAHKFIDELPEKYDYLLGESGSGISGGQLQRLEIAKALATGKKILILDEPTSNLDAKNSKEILSILLEINKKTKITIIIISHKKETIKYSDNLIKL